MTPADVAKLDLAAAYGEVASELRRDRLMTQAQVAAALGIARANYARSENGHHTPSVETFVRLAAVHELEPSQVFRLTVARAMERAGVEP